MSRRCAGSGPGAARATDGVSEAMRFETVVERVSDLPDPLPHGSRPIDPVLLGRPETLPDWTRSEPAAARRAAALVLLFPDDAGRGARRAHGATARHAPRGPGELPGWQGGPRRRLPGRHRPPGGARGGRAGRPPGRRAGGGSARRGRCAGVGLHAHPGDRPGGSCSTPGAITPRGRLDPAAAGGRVPARRAGHGHGAGARRLSHPLWRLPLEGPPHLGRHGSRPRAAGRAVLGAGSA